MKKSHIHIIILAGLCIGLSSCVSNMKVKVDVIDRQKLMTSPEVLLMEVFAISELEQIKLKNGFYGTQRKEIADAVDTMLTQLLVNKGTLGIGIKVDLMKDVVKEIDRVYVDQVIPKLEKSINDVKAIYSIRQAQDGGLTEQQVNLLYNARSGFFAARQQVNDFILEWAGREAAWVNSAVLADEDTASITNLYEEIIKPNLQAAYKENIDVSNLQAFHNGLSGDPLNSFITQAPKDYWKKTYNKTVAKNLMGNTDIAVVMETPGNFFIKGVRMDAENITSTLANTLSSGVKLLSKVNGINVSTPRGPAPEPKTTERTPGQSTVFDQEIKSKELEQQIEIREKLNKLSIISLMDAVIAQKDSLNSDTGYKEAVRQVQSIYKVHKAQFQTTETVNKITNSSN